MVDVGNEAGERAGRRLKCVHVFVEDSHDLELASALEEGARVRIAADTQTAVAERPAALLAVVGDLQERCARVRPVGATQVEMRVEVDDADALRSSAR